MTGRVDFVKGQLDEVIVAVLDDHGCATLSQRMHGPFRQPVVEKVNHLRTIAGPIINLYKKTMKFLGGGECQVFYAGSLKHPQ
jgi:AsmA protein